VVCGIALVIQLGVSALTWRVPWFIPEEWRGVELERTVGTLGRPAVFTSALTFFGVIVFGVSQMSPRRWVRGLGIVLLGLALLGMVWSYSRGSWVGALAVFGGIVWIYMRTHRRVLGIGAVLVLLLVGGLVALNPDWAWTRLTDFKTAEERLVDELGSVRMIAARPLLGWGYLNQNEYRPEFLAPVFSGRVVQNNPSHNTYLTMLAELGIPLFLLYCLPALWWSRQSWHRRDAPPSERGELIALLWLVLLHIFIVSNFSDLVSFHPVGTVLWWMTLGLIAQEVSTGNAF
jgi:O-antigen ligase